MINRILAVLALIFACGTAWGQVPMNANQAHDDSVAKGLLKSKYISYDKVQAITITQPWPPVSQASADSLRLIHQVDIVLEYLKERGYELPKTRVFANLDTLIVAPPDTLRIIWGSHDPHR